MITTSKLNSSIVFSLAIFWSARDEGRVTQTPFLNSNRFDLKNLNKDQIFEIL